MQAATQSIPQAVAQQQFEQHFRNHHQLVFRTAYRVTGNAADAEDALQTVFLRLLRQQLPADFAQHAKAYLHRAAVNAALDLMRARSRQAQPDDAALAAHVDTAPDAERQRNSTEIRQWLRRELAQLNPRAAEIFALYYLEGYSYPEITRMLKMSRGTVAVILFRTRSRLRKQLRPFLGGQS